MPPLEAPARVTLAPAAWRDFRDVLALERLCFVGDSWPWIDIRAALTFPEAVRLKATPAQEDGEGPGNHGDGVNGITAIGFVFGDRRRSQGLGWVASVGVPPGYPRAGGGGGAAGGVRAGAGDAAGAPNSAAFEHVGASGVRRCRVRRDRPPRALLSGRRRRDRDGETHWIVDSDQGDPGRLLMAGP